MKKVLSVILLVSMLAGIIALIPSANAKILPSGNVSFEAHYFDGTTQYKEDYGTNVNRIAWYDAETIKEGNSNLLTIDGIIEDGEWGDPIIVVDSDYAANNIDVRGNPIDATNTKYQTPSAENTYYYSNGFKAPLAGLSYTLYAMWDEDYLYIAAYVEDPDGHKNVRSGAGIWDGDCLQFRVDPWGSNAQTGGNYDATQMVDIYDDNGNVSFTTNAFPWKNSLISSKEWYAECGNYAFTYITKDGGHTEAWDTAPRYYVEYTDTEGNIQHSYSNQSVSSIDRWGDNSLVQDHPVYATVYTHNYGTAKEPDYKTGYEIAIPWENVLYNSKLADTFEAIAGTELGFSCVLLDGARTATPDGSQTDSFTSWLTFGSNICNSQITNDPKTAGGSNAMILSSTNYKDYKACNHTFSEATCSSTETCTICGYKRGFASGHTWEFYDVALPTTTKDGHMNAACSVCGVETSNNIKAQVNSEVIQAITRDETSLFNTAFQSGFTTNWYDKAASYYDSETHTWIENTDRKALYYANGSTKNSLDRETFGYTVIDMSKNIYPEQLYYVNGTAATDCDPEYLTGAKNIGSYLDWNPQLYSNPSKISAKKGNLEYSYNMQIYFTEDIGGETFDSKSSYNVGLHWYFGPKIIKYVAGFVALDGGETYAFYIGEAGNTLSGDLYDVTTMEYRTSSENFKKRCIVYKEVPAETFKTDVWHQINFIFDNNTGSALFFWDGELQVCAFDPVEYIQEDSYPSIIAFRRFGVSAYLRDVEISTISYAAQNYTLKTGATTQTYTATINGVANEYAAGETVNYSAPAFNSADAARLTGWEGDTDVLTDATAASGTFTMPEKAVTLTPKYTKVGDTNGDGKINAQDANYIAQIIVGSAPSVAPADINADGKVNATDANLMKKIITGTYAPVA